MAVILQTRCFQMDNCEPDLSFSKYVELDCFRWLYIYGLEHLNLNLNTVNWWILTGRDDVTKRRSSGASDFT